MVTELVDPEHAPWLPDDWQDLLAEAEARAYIELRDGKIKYNCARVREENFGHPEEWVRAALYAWLVIVKEYPPANILVEAPVPRRVPGDFADLVVYEDHSCRTPYLVVEAKATSCSEAEFRKGVEQGFGNANSLRDTHFCLIDSGRFSRLYQVHGFPQDEREENLLGDRTATPRAYDAVADFRFVAGADGDIVPVDAVRLGNLVRRAHGLIWAGGRRDPLTAFDEWCKLLFAKLHDERHTQDGWPRKFQIAKTESDLQTANRVRRLYEDARQRDPSIFTEPIALPDEKIAEVVRTLQQVSFTATEVDTLGTAFETFFGQIFRGALGQYFTRREIARFVCLMLRPTEQDRVLDPTAGSGGFLLETTLQVWRHIENRYAGQPNRERQKMDFARDSVYGIEIQDVLGRVCQTNLLIHKDGHTNIEIGRSCLDGSFRNPSLDPAREQFTIVIGNPPFGDEIHEGSRDQLGNNRLDSFELPASGSISSELLITERAVRWLKPGKGRIGFVVPDGMLNNAGESSRCPAFRRWLFRNCQLLAVVSLPDYAFRKSGAQNKTSVLFARRFSRAERGAMDAAIRRASVENEEEAIGVALGERDYDVFLAEAEDIGYTPTGAATSDNDLYSAKDDFASAERTIAGQYQLFLRDGRSYTGADSPNCHSIRASALYGGHRTHRIDPKYHAFRLSEQAEPPQGMFVRELRRILERREEGVIPRSEPDEEFRTITLTQGGELEPREAGRGNNPPAWFGAYFKEGQVWFRVREGDILLSRIDLWKGCIGIVPPEFDGGIVTREFPVYRLADEYRQVVSLRYVQLLLRTRYFRRALRSITTGHSNRRRTHEDDFLALRIFLPDRDAQDRVVDAIEGQRHRLFAERAKLAAYLSALDGVSLSSITADGVQEMLKDYSGMLTELTG